ncbi:transcriptional initiation protein Tat [bacterium]|nr:transcriptional initiation protein Tat [bacterium]
MVKATAGSVTVPVPNAPRGGLYVQNRAPLEAAPFIKLPIGSITPKGWLREQLELEANGMTGHLMEISPWLNFEKSSWTKADGSGNFGWEEMPYWLKGFGDLGYVLKDERIIAEAKKWIDAILTTQREDGYYGPRQLLTSLKGKPDLWPHMIVNNILQSWYDYSNDPRVVPFLLKYHRWLNEQPASTLANGYWPHIRFGDDIETCNWLYNRTGETFLLDLAKKIHENMAAWRDGVINWHNVNLAQGFREPGVFFTESGKERDLAQAEANYREIIGKYGQFSGGGFAGDENCRPGYTDPRQGFETCGMVEFTHSFEMLTKISGDVRWADRAEDVAFNSLPAAITPDWKGLHYLTAPNQVQLDSHNKAPDIDNGGTMMSYSPFEVYRCCQHNVSHGWPYYAEELWLATADNGLAASLYAASEVSAKVADGTKITITEDTAYPFDDTVTLHIQAPKSVKFPLHLRIPSWAESATINVNGNQQDVAAKPSTFAVVDREWNDGDVVTLTLPMKVKIRRWALNKNSASVDYGPLTFSLEIGEHWQKYGDRNPDWPQWEVYPTTPWNYGLVFDEQHPGQSFTVVKRNVAPGANPFTQAGAPIELRAQGRRIPNWQMDRLNVVGKLQPNPVKSDQPLEDITLIPMGAARLRITSFPVIGDGPDAHEWTLPKEPPVSASFPTSDPVDAMIDGIEPKNSNDHDIPRFTWWDHRGTKEWVEWGFDKPKQISEVSVYWFDDTGRGQCRVPQSWQILYRKGERWLPVEGASAVGTKPDQYNRVTFDPVTAEGVRLDVQFKPNFSAGILEWKVK